MMNTGDLLRAVILLASINYIHSQYYDFFQALQPFIQPQPSEPLNFLNDLTTKRPRPRQKTGTTVVKTDENIRKFDRVSITDNINESNVRKTDQTVKIKQTRVKPTNAPVFDFNFFTTTQRPARKTTKNPSNSSNNQKSQNRQQSQSKSSPIVFFDDTKSSFQITKSDSRERLDKESRPVRPNSWKTQNQALTASNNWYDGRTVNYQTTKPSIQEPTRTYFQNKNRNTNFYTTHNPLLNRPGVKPAVVHGPPITNKPVTQPAYGHRPQDIHVDEDLHVTPEVISGPNEDYMSADERRRYIDNAERMCDAYKSLNTKQVEAIPLVPSPQPVRVNVSSCPPTTVPLVVGGKVVTIQEFPHMALLGWKKNKNRGYSWKCGGSLLSNQFILTAAHCAYQDRDDDVIAGPPRIVQLGSSYLNDPKAVYMRVSAVTRHPKYKLPKAYYDLALIKMAKTVTFSDKIKPACLGTPPSANRPIIATGWGRTEFGGSQSQELRSVSIPVWDISDCHKALGVSMKIPYGPSSDSQICAGDRRGGKDTCQGDSGGPAQIQDGCNWRVVAVTSVGRFCGAADTPAIYATVQKAFISAVVFGKDTTQNIPNPNNKDSSTNNNWNKKTDQSNRPNQWNTPTTINYGNNRGETYNWNQGNNNLNNQRYPSDNNQPVRNEYSNSFNNYNSQTESYSSSNSRENYSSPSSENGEYYNNYAGNKDHRDNYGRQEVSNSETYNNDRNIWWT